MNAHDNKQLVLQGYRLFQSGDIPSLLELYHNVNSVCAQKVRIVLAEKNVPWTNHHLSLARGEQLTPEFKKMNPRGVVPVLVHDGNVIVESSVICSYLDEVFPNPPLTPSAA